MDFTRFRVWQWMLIGLFAGTVVGYSWTNLPNDVSRSGDVNDFRGAVTNFAGLIKQGRPTLIRNVVVLEPETDPSGVLKYPVRYDVNEILLMAPRERVWERRRQATQPAAAAYKPSGVEVKTPFPGTNGSVIDFLKKNNVPFTDRTGGCITCPSTSARRPASSASG